MSRVEGLDLLSGYHHPGMVVYFDFCGLGSVFLFLGLRSLRLVDFVLVVVLVFLILGILISLYFVVLGVVSVVCFGLDFVLCLLLLDFVVTLWAV